jgi:hypothetical protein
VRAQLLTAAALALAAMLFRDRSSAPALETKTLTIDANVNSPTFGQPIVDPQAQIDSANHDRLVALVAESSAAIAAYDAAHPELVQ